MKKPKLVIVGLGMAASRLLDELVKSNAQQDYDIVVFGEELVGGYNRILLSHVLSGEQTIDAIVSHDQTWFEQQQIRWFAGRKVIHIDTDCKQLTDAMGGVHSYDRLVLATGSLPVRAEVKGNNIAGVFSFRDVLDAQQLLALKANAGRVVVVGAGLLGLEAAYGLVKQGLSVTVVHRSDRIMSQQLDHAAASLLQAQLASLGIEFVLSAQLLEIVGETKVTGVRLTNGDTLAAQAVVMAMGIRPNIRL
ncbi:MAG: nitrite reductase, partial [Thiotrichales bacterium 34-46-19]